MASASGFLVFILQISWTIAQPAKLPLPDWSIPYIKPSEPVAIDKQVNDYLTPILSTYSVSSTPAPHHSFQPKDFSHITDLSDLIRYFQESLLAQKINLGGKKGSLLQITAVKPKSGSTSKAPLTILLATKPEKNNREKTIESVDNDKDSDVANQNLDLRPDTSDVKAVNEAKAAEVPAEKVLATNTNDESENKAVSFLTDLKLQNVLNEVLKDSNWKEDNADFILPDYNEAQKEEEVQKLDPVVYDQNSNQHNDGYPQVDADKELKDRNNNFQKDDKNKILINKEQEEALKTKAQMSDHKDHGPKIHREHGNGSITNFYNENKAQTHKNKTNGYENEDEKYDQETKKDVENNQWNRHRHHHHEIRNKTEQKYEAKNREDKPLYTRNDLNNVTLSIKHMNPDHDAKKVNKSYENDKKIVNYDEKNDDEESKYNVSDYGLPEKQASKELKYDQQPSNQEHKEDQENYDKENHYQETSHEQPEKQVNTELKQDQQEINHGHNENQEYNYEDKNYRVSDDNDEKHDSEAKRHEAHDHDVRLHVDHREDILDEILHEIVDAGNNHEKLLSDNTVAGLQDALTKAEEAKNQLNECNPAELSGAVKDSEFTKKPDHDNSNAKSYTLSFLFNK